MAPGETQGLFFLPSFIYCLPTIASRLAALRNALIHFDALALSFHSWISSVLTIDSKNSISSSASADVRSGTQHDSASSVIPLIFFIGAPQATYIAAAQLSAFVLGLRISPFACPNVLSKDAA